MNLPGLEPMLSRGQVTQRAGIQSFRASILLRPPNGRGHRLLDPTTLMAADFQPRSSLPNCLQYDRVGLPSPKAQLGFFSIRPVTPGPVSLNAVSTRQVYAVSSRAALVRPDGSPFRLGRTHNFRCRLIPNNGKKADIGVCQKRANRTLRRDAFASGLRATKIVEMHSRTVSRF
jgi:hypothetical protein